MAMVGAPQETALDLASLRASLRAHTGLTGKAPIGLIADFLDTSDPITGPGDDGAIVAVGAGQQGSRQVVVCGEALFPPFVAADPYGAGVAAVLANVNDVAAMGGVPLAIVNTVVGPPDLAEEIMRGMRDASEIYEVPIVGGHLTPSDGDVALSAFAIGEVTDVLSMANVTPGQALVFVCSLDGQMRTDFPFFTSLDNQAPRLARDIRLLDQAARSGLAVAAKDVSMAGPIGSLAMLLEYTKRGARIDLDRLPAPGDTNLGRWLVCFPTYAFWLAVPADAVDACCALFREHDLEAEAVGVVDDGTTLSLTAGGDVVDFMDLASEAITGLWLHR